jgi:hypothetical protein
MHISTGPEKCSISTFNQTCDYDYDQTYARRLIMRVATDAKQHKCDSGSIQFRARRALKKLVCTCLFRLSRLSQLIGDLCANAQTRTDEERRISEMCARCYIILCIIHNQSK